MEIPCRGQDVRRLFARGVQQHDARFTCDQLIQIGRFFDNDSVQYRKFKSVLKMFI